MKISPLFMVLLFAFGACKNEEETIRVIKKPITSVVYASGVVKSFNQYEVFATVSGIVSNVWVREGDTVKKGDALYTLVSDAQEYLRDNAQLAAAYASMQANSGKLQEASQSRDVAMNKMLLDSALYFRQKKLFDDNIGSRVELEQKELAYRNSKAAYVKAKVGYDDLRRQLELQEKQQKNIFAVSDKQLGDYTLRSDVDGVVFRVDKQKGELVAPQFPVALVGDANKFIIELQVDERDITKIKNGMIVIVSLDSYKGQTFEARVTRVMPLMNPRSKTFTVEAEFVTPPPVLYPFVTLEASIVLEEKQNALLIPVSYLLNDSTVLDADGNEKRIKTGLRDFNMVEVKSGLNENDEIRKPDA